MKVEQLDMSRRTIYLPPDEPKNEEARLVVMTNKVFELLSACIQGKGPNDYVLTRDKDRRGRRPKINHIVSYNEAWDAACKAAGCEGLLFHDLRRTAVRNMTNEAGIPEKVAMLISGHKTRSVFDRYHIVDTRNLQKAALLMEKAEKDREQREQDSQRDRQRTVIEQTEIPASESFEKRHGSVIASKSTKAN